MDRILKLERVHARGIVRGSIRILGLNQISQRSILDDAKFVVARFQVLELVGALRIGGRGGHNVACRVQQFDSHTLVELLASIQRLGTVAIAVDRALEGVVGCEAEIDLVLGGAGVVQGELCSRVLGLLQLLEQVRLLNLHRVLSCRELAEGVRTIGRSRGGCGDVSILVQQVDGDSAESLLARTHRRVTVLVVVDRTRHGVVLCVTEVHIGDIRIITREGNGVGLRVCRTAGVFGLLEASELARRIHLDRVGTVQQAGEVVISRGVSGGGCDNVARAVDQGDSHAREVDVIPVLRLIAVFILVDVARDRVLLHVTEVHVLANGVVRVECDCTGGIVLRAIRVFGLSQVGEIAILDDLDRVGACAKLSEGVITIRVSRGGGNNCSGCVHEVHGHTVEALFTGGVGRGVILIEVDLTREAMLDGDRRACLVVVQVDVVGRQVLEFDVVGDGLAIGSVIQANCHVQRGVASRGQVANGPHSAIHVVSAGRSTGLARIRGTRHVAGGAHEGFGLHEGDAVRQLLQNLGVRGQALTRVCGVDAEGYFITGRERRGIGSNALVECHVEGRGDGDLEGFAGEDRLVRGGLGCCDCNRFVGHAIGVIGSLDRDDQGDRGATLDRGGLAVDVDAVGLDIAPRSRVRGPVVIASSRSVSLGLSAFHDLTTARVVRGRVLDADLRGVNSISGLDLDRPGHDGCPLGTTACTGANCRVADVRQGAVDGHIRQVGVTGVGRGDAEGAVFTLTDQ